MMRSPTTLSAHPSAASLRTPQPVDPRVPAQPRAMSVYSGTERAPAMGILHIVVLSRTRDCSPTFSLVRQDRARARGSAQNHRNSRFWIQGGRILNS